MWSGMRLTGQATTAIGNALIDMIVHNRHFNNKVNQIVFAIFLGDDNSFG